MESMWVFSCKGVWEHWPVCSQNSKEIDNPGRYLYWGMSFLTGNRQSSSTNSPPVIDCLVFRGMWAAREEAVVKVSLWVAVDGPWMEMEMEIVMAAWQKHLDLGQKQIDICFWSGIQEIRVYMRAAGGKLGFSFGRTPHLWPPCCQASFAAMLLFWVRRFNPIVDGSWVILVDNRFSSRSRCRLRTTCTARCAYFEGGSEAWAVIVVGQIHVSTNPVRGLYWSGQSIPFVLTLLLELAAIE